MSEKAEIGIIGMGVMGKSLALNFAGKGVKVAVYNRHVPGKEENIAADFVSENSKVGTMWGFDSLSDFFHALEKPRKILLMVTAGPVIDAILKELIAFLNPEDVVMDGGNSFYKDTEQRVEALAKSGIYFLGVGVSGGEEGALKGPSLMPGGTSEGYDMVKGLLELAAAKDKNGKPCTSYLGAGGAGHFVKMVHNGIEYAEMQLLAEVYGLLKVVYNQNNQEIADFFKYASQNGADGFLTEVTIGVLEYKKDGFHLLDRILDKSEQKGTGSWTVKSGMDLGVPLSTISEAVMARYLSSQKDKRVKLAKLYEKQNEPKSINEDIKANLVKALNTARLINHLSGFDYIATMSQEMKWQLSLSEVARIWTNGCIIRSELMGRLSKIYDEDKEGWSHKSVISELNDGYGHLAEIISIGMKNMVSLPVMSASINHFNSITTSNSPANLIQAQRDFFGAHAYQRTDMPENQYFHTDWLKR